MDDLTYDATIVGSGPAGSSAAIQLARQGLKVCIVEKHHLPRYKACGGGVTARAANLLPVPLDSVIEETCCRFELHFQGRKQNIIIQRDKPIIFMVMRADMDALLLAEAKKLGVEVFENTEAKDVTQEKQGVTLLTNRALLRSSFLIAADGVSSIVAHKGGWPANKSTIPALESEVFVDPATLEQFRGAARFDLDHPRGGYSWVFPKKNHLSVGVLSMAPNAAGLRKSFYSYLEMLNIQSIGPLKLDGALIPLKPRPGLLARGRILLVGDAAGLAEPISAEGISNALLSGLLAARALTEGNMDPHKAAFLYQRNMDISILRELGTAELHARMLYRHRHIRNLMFRLMGEKFCEYLIDITAGERSFANLGNPLRMLVKMGRWIGQGNCLKPTANT
jgi:geranylgeranyl reductase family protein